MKASSAAKPFSGAGNQNLFKEMDNLSPFMQPDQMEEKPWWQNISLGQVVSSHPLIFCVFHRTHICYKYYSLSCEDLHVNVDVE